MSRGFTTLPRICAGLAVLCLLAGCGEEFSESEKQTIASLALSNRPPLPDDPSNKVADDPLAAALGATFFFSTAFSANDAVSCATCHKVDRQFQDDLPRAEAIGTSDRRTMPLADTAYSPFLFWDGRVDSLWAQALVPLEDPVEHGSNRVAIVRTVKERFGDRYENIFGPLPDMEGFPPNASPRGEAAGQEAWAAMEEGEREAVNRVYANIGKAIAAFERSIRHGQTRFDRFAAALAEGRDPEGDAAFSDLETEGLKLFIGPGNCIDCHGGPRFTDDHFHNTGVARAPGIARDRGRAAAIETVLNDPFNCRGAFSDAAPEACEHLTYMNDAASEFVRAFKAPSLRGVADRAPYMHAGQLATLEDVIEHYATSPEAPEGRSELEDILLTDRARSALIAFLKTLDADDAE